MKHVYVMIKGRSDWENIDDWENMVIFLTKEEAIEASIKYSITRIEIFGKEDNMNGYVPTYTYYKNGILFTSF
jgi:hypothetical protein